MLRNPTFASFLVGVFSLAAKRRWYGLSGIVAGIFFLIIAIATGGDGFLLVMGLVSAGSGAVSHLFYRRYQRQPLCSSCGEDRLVCFRVAWEASSRTECVARKPNG